MPHLPSHWSPDSFRMDRFTLIVFIILTSLRFFLAFHLGISDDEAYYWTWAQSLQLSYFDHPPLTAWLIAAAQLIFGSSIISVRLWSWLLSSISALMLWRVTCEMFSPRAGQMTLLLYLFVPIFSLGSLMMVPDIPMGLFWILIIYYSWKSIQEKKIRYGSMALCLGLGFISKYTVVLAGLSMLLLVLTTFELRKALRWKSLAIAILLFLVLGSPIFIWNMKAGWPSFYFHLSQRHQGGGEFHWAQWGNFWLSQIMFVTPLLFGLMGWALVQSLKRFKESRWRLIFCFSVPTLALFSGQALFAEFKPHWPAPAYLALLIGCGGVLDGWFDLTGQLKEFRIFRKGFLAVLFLIMVPINLFFYIETLYPLAPKIHRMISKATWLPKWDPTNDLYGWGELNSALDTLMSTPELMGTNPFISSYRYQIAAPLQFYRKNDRVWCLSEITDQFDFSQTPSEIQSLRGRSSLVITDNRFNENPADRMSFKSCQSIQKVEVYRYQELARVFEIWGCHEFQP